MQSIAHNHSVPLTYTSTPSTKRTEQPPTPAPSVDGSVQAGVSESEAVASRAAEPSEDRPKKKRRVALTRVGDIDP